MIETTLFWILAPATVACAVLVIVLRNAVGSAIFLIITFLLSAGIYILLEAPFIAAIQVLVYAGAIMVLFLFVIMLLNLEKEPKAAGRFQLNKTVGVLLGIILLAQLGIVFLSLSCSAAANWCPRKCSGKNGGYGIDCASAFY